MDAAKAAKKRWRRFLKAKRVSREPLQAQTILLRTRAQEEEKFDFDSFTMAALAWMRLGSRCRWPVVGRGGGRAVVAVWLCAVGCALTAVTLNEFGQGPKKCWVSTCLDAACDFVPLFL